MELVGIIPNPSIVQLDSPGETQSLAIQGYYSDGVASQLQKLPVQSVGFVSSDESIVSVTPEGLLTALDSGGVEITVSLCKYTAEVPVLVWDPVRRIPPLDPDKLLEISDDGTSVLLNRLLTRLKAGHGPARGRTAGRSYRRRSNLWFQHFITDTSGQTGRNTADLAFRTPPDFDRPADSNRDNEYLVTVRPYDGSNYGDYKVTVTVTADNEPPVITGDDTRDFRENGTGTIYTYRATDPEGDEFTWSVGGQDGRYFEVSDKGGLSFETPPDFESPMDSTLGSPQRDNVYEITVVASDGNNQGTLAVTVTVTDVNEGPVIQETPDNTDITVRENNEGVLFTYSATDPEDPTADITRWSVTGTDGGDFTVNEDGELTFRNQPDHEGPADSNRDNEYLVTVRASDGRYYGTLDVTVTVEAVNEAPEFRSGTTTAFIYQENGTSDLYTYRATDPEESDVTWGLSGADRSAFTISETGVLTFNDPTDYESPTDSDDDNVYEVTEEASDRDGNTDRLEVTVTVTNLTD